jgi:hypothetical protein
VRKARSRGNAQPDAAASAAPGRPGAAAPGRGESGPLARSSGTEAGTGVRGTVDGVEGAIVLPHRIVALTALTLVSAVLLSDGYLAAGPAGFVVAGTVLALLAMLAARAMISPDDEPPPRAVRDNRRSGESSQADFPAYREITSDLYWAGSSRRHYDHGLRSRLAGLLDARLAQQYGLDAAAQPDRARELFGAELWPLVDTSQPPSNDSHVPGVSLGTLARIVTRLEEL